jgi:hypothetical protein
MGRKKRIKFYQLTDEEYIEIRKLAYKHLECFREDDREEMIQEIAVKVSRRMVVWKAKLSTLVNRIANDIVGDWARAKDRKRRIPEKAFRYAFNEKEWERVESILVRQETGRTPKKKNLEDYDNVRNPHWNIFLKHRRQNKNDG